MRCGEVAGVTPVRAREALCRRYTPRREPRKGAMEPSD